MKYRITYTTGCMTETSSLDFVIDALIKGTVRHVEVLA